MLLPFIITTGMIMGIQVKSILTTVRNKWLSDLCASKLYTNKDPIQYSLSILNTVTAYIKNAQLLKGISDTKNIYVI